MPGKAGKAVRINAVESLERRKGNCLHCDHEALPECEDVLTFPVGKRNEPDTCFIDMEMSKVMTLSPSAQKKKA